MHSRALMNLGGGMPENGGLLEWSYNTGGQYNAFLLFCTGILRVY